MMNMKIEKRTRHIAVDLDSTLAVHEWKNYDPNKIGEPIPLMVARVKNWLAKGHKVTIHTARMSSYWPEEDRKLVEELIKAWCREHIGTELEVGCEKHPQMDEIWDDRAVSVEANTGRILTVGKEDEPEVDGIGQFLTT